jgi:hypothetical protein
LDEDIIASLGLLVMVKNNYRVEINLVFYFLHLSSFLFLSKFDVCVHQSLHNQLFVFMVVIGLWNDVEQGCCFRATQTLGLNVMKPKKITRFQVLKFLL